VPHPEHSALPDPNHPNATLPVSHTTQDTSFQASLGNITAQYDGAVQRIAELEKHNTSLQASEALLRNQKSSLQRQLKSAQETIKIVTEERDDLKEQLQEAFREMAFKYKEGRVAGAEQVWQHIAAGSKGSLIFAKPWVKESKAVTEE
ncbi:MAG: hypothetical protein Q9184_003526, partial [Pyrenodesmia sp. 2 TL-2023]